ncbi:hypothetical protein [Kitasatospora sp. NPDC057500]|uniref:hypothetical protein n=1 Tax=Kitasatospora sp. NPDC057500 TaxID=3346151 RepID=UPI0036D0CD5C
MTDASSGFTPDSGSYRPARPQHGGNEHRTLPEVGHNVPQEAPGAFVRAVLDADRL